MLQEIMKLPNSTKETATPEATGATPPSRKRPLSAANNQVVPGGLRPPSRAPSALGWGPLCAPQISIPDSRLHLTSSRPRSRFNSVKIFFYSLKIYKNRRFLLEILLSPRQCGKKIRLSLLCHFVGKDVV